MRGLSTFLTFSVLAVAIVASGCASAGPPPGTTAYNGMVWTWDEQENWVTLRQGRP